MRSPQSSAAALSPPLGMEHAAQDRLGGRAAVSRLTSLWALYVLTLRQHVHGKRWMVMAGLFLLSAGLAVLMRATSSDAPAVELEFIVAFLFIPQAILPLLALVYASGIVRDEQEEQTMTYLLIRPIPKWALYLVKLFATLTTTVCLAAALTALIYVAIYAGANSGEPDVVLRCAKAAGVHALAVVTYCCLFGLLSLLTNRALIVGALYAVFIEGFLANMPFSIRMATVIYYTRLIAYRSLPFLTMPSGRRSTSNDIAAAMWQLDINEDPGLAQHPQIATCVIVLLAASLFCAVFGAVLFSRREFYVKTPEKA